MTPFTKGASARHLTGHAIELALILEDALRKPETETPVVSDYMVRNPVCAELWQPISLIRQQMLTGSFSFLPLQIEGKWWVVSDRAVAAYLGADWNARKLRLAKRLDEAETEKELKQEAKCLPGDISLEEAIEALKDSPLLVIQKGACLLGIVTAFDLL
jgi:hypothetical protein